MHSLHTYFQFFPVTQAHLIDAVILCYGVGESSLTNIIVVAVKIIVLLMFIFTVC
jgi:hypothetical protein